MGARLPLGTCRKYEISIEIARLKGARCEGAKTSPSREVLLLPNSLRGAVCLKHRGKFRALRSAT